MTEKRYQVFISSTFRDLIDERQAALKAVLELDHMPAGMELFPASDVNAWQLIKDVIDSSDYYVLLIGGRYGSLDKKGLGFTEKEYDYAIKSKKPVIPLLHQNPDNLAREKTETDPDAWEKLEAFRAKVEEKHTCVYWKSAEDLKSKLIIGLTSNVKRRPASGWIRADKVPTNATVSEILSLKEQVSELEKELERIGNEAPSGIEDLLQGDDTFEIDYEFESQPHGSSDYFKITSHKSRVNATWNEIFAGVAPVMINEANEYVVRQAFQDSFERFAKIDLENDESLKGQKLNNFDFGKDEINTCLVQLRALGLIRESVKRRALKDTSTYWCLTPYGDRLMDQLRALRRH